MKDYQCVFFDLDHTLWDYDKNSRETLEELYVHYGMDKQRNIGFEQFHATFQQVNLRLWDQYDRGQIDRFVIRDNRFQIMLAELNVVDHKLARELSEHYLVLSPTKKNLIEHAKEILDYLLPKYPLVLVTNGFEGIQSTKVASGGIEKYFKAIVTSEKAGHKKPAKEIFEYALSQCNSLAQEAIMIGDNLLTDMAGAANAKIDSVLYNPKKESHNSIVTYEIKALLELKEIL